VHKSGIQQKRPNKAKQPEMGGPRRGEWSWSRTAKRLNGRRRSCRLPPVYNLTTAQHDRLRNLVRRSPVFTGMRVTVHEDRVEVGEPEDLVFGLAPVEDAVAGAPMDQWAGLVDDCLGRILAALTGDTPGIDGPAEEFLDRVHAKLRPADPNLADGWTYAREVAPGLLVMLAVDFPDHIAILNDEQVEQHGYDRLLDAGLHNLRGQLPEECATHEGVFVIAGSAYTASTALVLPWVVEAVTGETDLPHGVLVAVPNDEMLVFHVPRDGAGTRYALDEMARVATEYHAGSPRPLSPEVYWWAGDGAVLAPVTPRTDDAVIGQDFRGDGFAKMLAELG